MTTTTTTTTPLRVAVACQGGGSHTAYTAGVLKVFLASQAGGAPFRIVALSGTSGGAMCAALAWDGLLRGEPRRGADQLGAFWQDVAANDPLSAALNHCYCWGLRLRHWLTYPELSPYAAPPWGQRELRAALLRRLDFPELRGLAGRPEAPALAVGAVEVRSGRFEVFRGPGLTVECLLASAALPELFPAVGVAGRGVFWDGQMSQNPPVRELAELHPDELWVIQVNPPTRPDVPMSLGAIRDRRNELMGNLSLEQELFFVEKVNDWLRQGYLAGGKYRPVRVRRLPLTLDLDLPSKMDRSPHFLRHLTTHGEAEARRFLAGFGFR